MLYTDRKSAALDGGQRPGVAPARPRHLLQLVPAEEDVDLRVAHKEGAERQPAMPACLPVAPGEHAPPMLDQVPKSARCGYRVGLFVGASVRQEQVVGWASPSWRPAPPRVVSLRDSLHPDGRVAVVGGQGTFQAQSGGSAGSKSESSAANVRIGPGLVVGPSNRTVTRPRPAPQTHPGPSRLWRTSWPGRHTLGVVLLETAC